MTRPLVLLPTLAIALLSGCAPRLTNPIGAGRSKRVDRTEPSGNDWLKNATRRRPLIQKEAAKEDAPDVSEP